MSARFLFCLLVSVCGALLTATQGFAFQCGPTLACGMSNGACVRPADRPHGTLLRTFTALPSPAADRCACYNTTGGGLRSLLLPGCTASELRRIATTPSTSSHALSNEVRPRIILVRSQISENWQISNCTDLAP